MLLYQVIQEKVKEHGNKSTDFISRVRIRLELEYLIRQRLKTLPQIPSIDFTIDYGMSSFGCVKFGDYFQMIKSDEHGYILAINYLTCLGSSDLDTLLRNLFDTEITDYQLASVINRYDIFDFKERRLTEICIDFSNQSGVSEQTDYFHANV